MATKQSSGGGRNVPLDRVAWARGDRSQFKPASCLLEVLGALPGRGEVDPLRRSQHEAPVRAQPKRVDMEMGWLRIAAPLPARGRRRS